MAPIRSISHFTPGEPHHLSHHNKEPITPFMTIVGADLVGNHPWGPSLSREFQVRLPPGSYVYPQEIAGVPYDQGL